MPTLKKKSKAKPRPATEKRPAKNGYVLPSELLQKREDVFAVYCLLGPKRSLYKLCQTLKHEYPNLAVSEVTLQRWSIRHNWRKRVAQYDRGQAPAPVLHVMPDGSPVDDVTMLLHTATAAINRALNAAPAVTKVSDVKALIATAMDALKLVDQIKARDVSKNTRQEIADEIARLMRKIDNRRRGEIEKMFAWIRKTYPADEARELIDNLMTAADAPDEEKVVEVSRSSARQVLSRNGGVAVGAGLEILKEVDDGPRRRCVSGGE